jgi:PAS domain S-box-containing protein
MLSYLQSLFDFFNSANLAPHGLCLLWRPELIWLHVVSDGFIAIAYFSIPIVLAQIVAKRQDVEFGWVFWAFSIFIAACGTTHIMGIWTLWFPDYAAEGAVKAITAVASLTTAIGLWPLLPKILALPSPEQLRKANEALMSQVEQRDCALRALEQEKAERLRAEEMLRSLEQHRQIERLVAVTPDAVIVTDTDGIVQFANEAAVKLFDKDEDDIVGRAFDFPIETADVLQIQTTGTQRSGDLRVTDCEWADKPARLAVIRDNTERDRIEVKRKFAEEKFRLAVEACPNGMIMIDSVGKIVMVNAEIERSFGYQREELIGQTVDILVPVRLNPQHVQHRDKFMAHPETRRMGEGRDLFGRRKDGSEFPVEVGLNPIHAREGVLVLSVIVDITERKRNERLKDEFVATVSHELRTPLTSIAGSLGLLANGHMGKMTAAAKKRLLTIAYTNSQRLVRLVNDILDIEKLDSGQANFNLDRVEVRSLVEQTVETNRSFAEDYHVRIRLEAAGDPCDVRADADRLAQVVTNLLSNAIKFCRSDDEVVVAVEKRSSVVRISVRDHGPGIPADFRSHIFEKFAQAEPTNARQRGGTGLGLSIVKQIITRLGGEVNFQDAPGGGTIFYVDLPCWDDAAEREIDPGAPSAYLLHPTAVAST